MIYFFDTSALVKRYHQEKGTVYVDEIFEGIVEGKAEAFISSLTLLEVTSAFKRKQKGNMISESDFYDLIKTCFDEIIEHFTIVPANEDIINDSIENVLKYSLKTLDSIQFQTVKEVKEMLDDDITVVTSDKELMTAFEEGEYEGVNPEEKV
ncbi:MAG: type II toxin-antitoxin system VapC family toxin [Candidatus Natronoplasma sp.]